MRIRATNSQGKVLFDSELSCFPLIIGRASPAQILISSDAVSSKHAEINWDGTFLEIRDLGSTNGTFSDGQRFELKKITLPCTIELSREISVEFADAEVDSTRVVLGAPLSPRPALPASPPPAPTPVPMTLSASPVSTPTLLSSVGARLNSPLARSVRSDDWMEHLWETLSEFETKKIVLITLALSGLLALLATLVFGDLWVIAIHGFTLSIVALAALIVASLVALVGKMFRGSFDWKPVFLAMMISSAFLVLRREYLSLMEFTAGVGLVVKMLMWVFQVAINGFWVLLFWMTVCSHRFRKTILTFSCLGLIGVGLSAAKDSFRSRVDFAREAFEDDKSHVSRKLAGQTVSPAAFVRSMISRETSGTSDR